MSITVALVGLVVGMLIGLTGVGGGSLLTPILVWMGLPVTAAVGTDLVSNAVTKFVGMIQHHRQRSVAWPWVIALASGGAPAALVGTLVVAFVRGRPDAEAWLKHVLGLALMLATGATLLQTWLGRRDESGHGAERGAEARNGSPANETAAAGPSPRRARPGAATYGLGAATGLFVGLTSVGAGSLVAPVLFLLSPLSPRQVVGTDIASALVVTAVAGAAHAAIGTVDVLLAANLLLGSIPGVWLGSRLTLHVPRKPLRLVISGIMFLTGLRWLT